MTAPFTITDPLCFIKYTLVHKGTDTDVVAEGLWPEIVLANEQNDGNVGIQFTWTSYRWRAAFEATAPEFEIVAQGHEPIPWASGPYLSQLTARIPIKVNFQRQCVLDVPAGVQ